MIKDFQYSIYKRVVIKIGSSTLTHAETGSLNFSKMERLFVFRMIRKDYYKKHPEEEPHYGTMYVSDLNKSKNDEGGDVDEKRKSD